MNADYMSIISKDGCVGALAYTESMEPLMKSPTTIKDKAATVLNPH